MSTAIEFNHVSKQYRLGLVSTKTLSHDLQRWWTMNVLRKEDPYLKIGETNDRSVKGTSDYVWALKDIDFKVEQGDVVGIIGKNGAGKSTLLKLLSKVTGPTTGSIRACGRIGSLLEVGTGFHPEMTGRENIFMNGAILGMNKFEIAKKLDEIVDFSGCERYLDTPVKRYSSGMMVRLGFAVAAHLDPEILVVDEVLAVGDAEFQKKAIGKMQDVSKGEGRTVLFVSHNMVSIKNLCKTGVLLDNGTLKNIGNINDIVEEYITSNLKEIGDVEFVTESQLKRLGPQTKEFEIKKVKRTMPYAIDSDDDIRLEVTIQRNNVNITKFQLTALVDNIGNGGERSGMAFSSEITWPADCTVAELEVRIPEHHLAQGKYIIDIWTSIGDILSSYKYYDCVYDTITFKIETLHNQQINEWHNYWGENNWCIHTKFLG